MITILPITYQNYKQSGDFIFIAWQGGYNFYLGNNKNASGWSAVTSGIDMSWKGGYDQSIAQAEQVMGHQLSKSEISNYWYDKTFTEIKENPSNYFSLFVKKIALLANGYEIPNNHDIYITKDFGIILKPLLFYNNFLKFPYGILLPFALIGFIFSFQQWRKYLLCYIFVFSYSLSLLLFFVCARFRQPLIPLLIIFAVFGISKLYQVFFEHRIKHILFYTIFVIGFLGLSNYNILKIKAHVVKAENHLMFGNAYLRKNNLNGAISEFRKSIEAFPTFERGYVNLGVILSRQKNYTEAIKYFKSAIILNPNNPVIYFNLSICYLKQNNYNGSVNILEKARRQFPMNEMIITNLAITYFTYGEIEKAKKMIEKSILLKPADLKVRNIYQEIQNAFKNK